MDKSKIVDVIADWLSKRYAPPTPIPMHCTTAKEVEKISKEEWVKFLDRMLSDANPDPCSVR